MDDVAQQTDDASKTQDNITKGLEPGEILQGHFWRYEYFNYHYNATYFMNHYCMEDAFPKDTHGCGNDAPGKFNPQRSDRLKSDYSLTYSPLPGHNLHGWSIEKRHNDVDWLLFGRGGDGVMQKRRLDPKQGLIFMPKEFVEDKCSNYCETELFLPMDPTIRSHAELYNDVDDMCDRCA